MEEDTICYKATVEKTSCCFYCVISEPVMFSLLGGAWVVGNYFVKLALGGEGGWERKQLRAFSAVNNHKIYLEKPCRVTTEIQCLGIGSSLLKRK